MGKLKRECIGRKQELKICISKSGKD